MNKTYKLNLKRIVMAELNVEKKKKSPIGWIILGIAVLALVIWFVASDNDDIQDTAQFNQEEEQTSEYGQEQSQAVAPYDGERSRTESNTRVQEYVTFVEEKERADYDMNHTVVQEGITKLSDALKAVANEQTQGQGTWDGELDQIKQDVSQLQGETLNQQHSTVIRSAFSSAANVIQNIQNKYYPEFQNDASDIMDAAQDIDAQELASEQKNEIHSFFKKTADLLEKMDERTTTSSLQ
jgi:hypothetical protein